jgi:hypothetical protein
MGYAPPPPPPLPPQKPPKLLNKLIKNENYNECPTCNSSFYRYWKWFLIIPWYIKTNKCIQPQCQNYYEGPPKPPVTQVPVKPKYPYTLPAETPDSPSYQPTKPKPKSDVRALDI